MISKGPRFIYIVYNDGLDGRFRYTFARIEKNNRRYILTIRKETQGNIYDEPYHGIDRIVIVNEKNCRTAKNN